MQIANLQPFDDRSTTPLLLRIGLTTDCSGFVLAGRKATCNSSHNYSDVIARRLRISTSHIRPRNRKADYFSPQTRFCSSRTFSIATLRSAKPFANLFHLSPSGFRSPNVSLDRVHSPCVTVAHADPVDHSPQSAMISGHQANRSSLRCFALSKQLQVMLSAERIGTCSSVGVGR